MDSSALTCLVTFHREVEHNGGRLTLKNVPRTVRRILEMTKLDEVFREVE